MADQDLDTTIKFSVDATGVEVGTTRVKRSLKDIGQTASDVGKQTGASIGGGGDDAAKKIEAATRRISNEFRRLQIDAESMGKSLSEKIVIKADAYGVPRAAIEEQRAALKAFEDAQRAANPAMVQFQKLADASGTSVKGLSAALKQVPAQFTDIIVSLQGGQAPLTVLLQQGGQLKDTFGGIGNAARALGGYVVSLINPFTLAAAAVGTLGYSYFQGSKELDEYRKALILTGNAVGLTGGQMQDMARSMAAVSGTQTAASEALVAFVNAGASGSDSLQKFAQSALNFSKVTGQAVEDIAKQFADLGKNPLEASVKLNESTNFLTMSLYEQIKALDEQGKKTEAANVAQQAYSDTLNQNTSQITANLGTIEKGWNAIASATKGAWDWMKNIGRDDGPTQKLAKLQLDVVNAENNLKSAIASSFGGAASGKAQAYKKELQEAQDKLAEFNKTTALAQIRASDRGIEAQAVKDKIEWDKTHQSQLDKLQQSLHKEVEDYAKLKAAGKDDAATRLQYEQRIHHLVKQEADYLKGEYKTELKTQKPKAESFDAFGKELTATKQWLATKERMIQDSYSTQQKSIEDAYKNQEISASQYYTRQLANDEKALSDSEKVRAEAQARFDVEMAKRVSETKARPAGNDRTTALRDLAAESQNFAESQKAARQKELNDMATHSGAMAREIEKQAQKVSESADTYIADMQRKAEADAKLLAAREAMAGQAPEIIAGMEAELKVRADAAKILEQTAQAYAKAAEEARTFEDALARNFADGKEATNAEILVLETLQSAARRARKSLVELGGAVDSSAMEAGITATAASIKKQTDDVAKEVQKTLADGILSAGKDGGAGLRKALEDVLITKPFRIVVEAMLQPVSTAIAQGIMGQSIGGSVAGATGFQTAMNAASLAVSTFGSNAMEAAKAVTIEGASFGEVVSTISSELASGKLAAGIGGAVGAAAPFAIAAVAAQSLFNAMQGSVTPTGTFLYGGQGRFGGRQDFAQSGGLFGGGNTKNSSWFDPDPAVAQYMGAIEQTVITSVKGWASAIGLSADAVDNYSKQVEVSIGGLDAKGVQEAIGKAFSGMADDIAQVKFGDFLLPLAKNWETLGATLQRLGTDLTTVNGILSSLNKPLFDSTMQGVQSMEAFISSLGGLDQFKFLASNLEAVNNVLIDLGQTTFDISVDGAKAAEELSKSVGGSDKLQMLASDLIKVNANLENLGQPLLDISVASAKAAHGMLKATDMAVKAQEQAAKLEASYASFSSNLSNADTSSVSSLQAVFNKALAAVTVSIPSIKGVSDLTSVTQGQYSSYNDSQRTKLDAAASAFKDLQNAINSAAKTAESAAKTAKDSADAAVKAYSDALKAIEKDTRNVNRELADFGKTDFQKKLSKIGYDSQDKLAELDELSAKAAELSATATGLSLKATDATIGAVSTMTDGLITASQDLSKDAQEVAANVSDALGNSVAAFGDALELAPAIATLFDEILKGLQKIPPALALVSNAVTGVGSAASTASGGLTAFGAAAGMVGSSASSATGPLTSAGAAFNAVSPAAAAAGAALNALGGAFDTASAALGGLTGTFGAASAAVDGLNAAFSSAASGLGGLTSALSSAAGAGASLAGSMGSVSGALDAISGAAAGAAGSISSAASALSAASGAAASVPAPVVVAAASGGAIHGPGTSTSDSIPAMLSDGEFVIKASSVDKYGLGFLNALNAGTLKSTVYRSSGGVVGENADAQRQLLYLNTFQSTIEMLGGTLKVFVDSLGKTTGAAVQTAETYTQAAAKLSGAGLDIQGLDAAGVKALILGVLDANKPTVNPATGLLEFSASAQAALAPLAGVLDSVGTVLKGLEDQKPWKDKLDVLTGKTTERQQALQRDLASTTDMATKSLILQVYAQEDMKAAAEKAAAAAEATAKENASWQDKIALLTKSATQREIDQRNALKDATDESTKALINQYYAQVDLSEALEMATSLADNAASTLKGQQTNAARLNVDYLTVSGDTAGAAAAQKAIDLADVYTALDDATQKLATATDAEVRAKLQSAITSGQETIALYETNKRREAEIETLKKYQSAAENAQSALASSADMLTNSRAGLLEAQGDTAGAAALRRSLDIKPYLDAITEATTGLATATTQAEKDILNQTIASSKQAISNYDTAKALDAQAQAAIAAQDAANALASAYNDLNGQIEQARVALLRASGNSTAADELEFAIATREHEGDVYYATLQRELVTLRKLTEARQTLNTLEDSALQNQIKLKRAQGEGVLANALERSAFLKNAAIPSAQAQAELNRSNMSFAAILQSRGLSITGGDSFGLAGLSSDLSPEDRRIKSAYYDQQTGTPGNQLNMLLREFASIGRTDAQKASLQNVIDTSAQIAAAYDRNKALEGELKIIELQDEAYKQSLDAQNAVKDAQKAYADVLRSTIETMQDFIKTLDGGASPLQSLSSARANFQGIAGRAASGDTSAYKDLTPAARAFLDLSKNYSRSIQDYQRDEAKVRATLNAVIQVNQSELDKLPKEIAEASDPTKQAWKKLQDALAKEADASIVLSALQVDQEASKRRLRTAEETLSDRYIEAVYLLDETKKNSLLDAFNTAVQTKVDEAPLPDYSMTFDLAQIWGDKIADSLPRQPLTNQQLNAIVAEKFPGLKPSDFVATLTPEQLSTLVSGVMPTITASDIVGEPTNIASTVNAQIAEILPSGFAGQAFNAQSMMQDAINRAMSGVGTTTGTGVVTPPTTTVTPPPATVVTPPETQTAVVAPVITNAVPTSHKDYLANLYGAGASFGNTFEQNVANLRNVAEQAKAQGFHLSDLQSAFNQVHGVSGSSNWDRFWSATGLPSFAVGTNYVPHDMLAQIHQGEAIIPAPFNPERYGRASGNDALVEEIKALREEVARLRSEQMAGQNAIAANTRKTAQVLTKFDVDGLPENRT